MRISSAALLALIVVSTGPAVVAAPSGPPIKLTAILSTSGRYAVIGGGQKNSVTLAEKEINAHGGIAQRPVEITIVDDQGDPAIASQLATQAIGSGALGLICGDSNAASQACARVATSSKVVDIFLTPASEIWNTPNGVAKYIFETTPGNPIEAPALLEFAQKKFHVKRAAIIYDENSYGQEGNTLLNASAKTYGIDISDAESYPGAATDFTPQLSKIRASNPDTVFIWGAATAPGLISRGIKQNGLQAHVIGTTGIHSPNFLTVAGSAGYGTFSDSSFDITHPDPAQRAFLNAYHDAYHATPTNFAAYAYDAVTLFAYALNKTHGNGDGDSVSNALENMSPQSLTNGPLHYTPKDHNGLTTSNVHIFEDRSGVWIGI